MLGIAERHGWSESYFLPHSTLALGLTHLGRDAEAVDSYQRGITAAERADDRLNLAVLHENLGRHHYLADGLRRRSRSWDGRSSCTVRRSAISAR